MENFFLKTYRKIKLYYCVSRDRHLNFGHKNQYIQMLEMFFVLVLTRVYPGYYLQAKMGGNCTWDYKLGFYSHRKYIRAVNKVNDIEYQKASMNKMVEKAMFSSYGLPTPKLLGFFNQLRGRDVKGNPLTSLTEFKKFIFELELRKICLKPTSSFGGIGFRAIDIIKKEREVYFYDNFTEEELDINNYMKNYIKEIEFSDSEGIVVEEYMVQHSDFEKYNPSSVNTVRVMVSLNRVQGPVFGAFLRVGRAGSVVDNGTSGGIMVKVNVNSGELYSGCFTDLSNEKFDNHPDSGIAFKGEILPFWTEIKELSVSVVKLFPKINFAGLDIAVTKTGPIVIEMNVQPDYVDFALIDIPTRDILA